MDPRGARPQPSPQRAPAVREPAKVLRLAAMAREIREELRRDGFDDAAQDRLQDLYRSTIDELQGALSGELRGELDRLVRPLGEAGLSEPELRVAEAQLSGWLDGLFQGMQANMLAQRAAMLQARQPVESDPRRERDQRSPYL